MINLNKTYRTREGNRVRALRYHYQDKKVILEGQNRSTGQKERVIIGEVHRFDELSERIEWCTTVWDEQGCETFSKTQHDLVEYVDRPIRQPELF